MDEDMIANGLFLSLRSQSIAVANRFTLPNWFECDVLQVTRAGRAIEHEIKCSVADFRADAKKSKRVMRHVEGGKPWQREEVKTATKHDRLAAADEHAPSRFYFVVPKGLIAPEDIPPWAGLKYATPGINGRVAYVRSVKRAPEIHRREIDKKIIRRMNRNLAMRYWWCRINGKTKGKNDGS